MLSLPRKELLKHWQDSATPEDVVALFIALTYQPLLYEAFPDLWDTPPMRDVSEVRYPVWKQPRTWWAGA